MNKVAGILGIAIIVFIGITGGFLYKREHIPPNAKIYVLEDYQTWIPNVQWANEIFIEQASKSDRVKETFAKRIESTYKEVITGKFKEFNLPESWKTGDYKQRIFWGENQSLLRSWVFPKKRRWNENGEWNY